MRNAIVRDKTTLKRLWMVNNLFQSVVIFLERVLSLNSCVSNVVESISLKKTVFTETGESVFL